MLKKKFLFIFLLLPVAVSGQNFNSELSKNDDIISNFLHLSPRQLFDTAKYYQDKNVVDTALIIYNMLINTHVKDANSDQQKAIILALNNSAVIYYNMCDFRNSYKHLINALQLCENTNNKSNLAAIYNNIGNIYHRFKNFEMSDMYYTQALNNCFDSITVLIMLNNLGFIKLEKEKPDSAIHFLTQALQISERHNNQHLHAILNNIAMYYLKQNYYDSASYYYQLSLQEAEKNYILESKALTLLNLGNMFFDMNKIDSALFYFALSKEVAVENNFLKILEENFLMLSKIEEIKGNNNVSFDYFKKYTAIKDSLLNIEVFDEITQIQRLYEVSKTNQQIENLIFNLKVKEQTIFYQKIIWFITLGVLALVCVILYVITSQKKKLFRANNAIVEKNVEIIELQKNNSAIDTLKVKKRVMSDTMQEELMKKILEVMKDISIVCNSDFSLNKLAKLTHSNQKYVSETINNVLNKNFRSFLNSYRVREAQRLFSELDPATSTIENVANQVGFKSLNSFNEAFKDIAKVSPGFYFKSVQKQKNT